MKKMVVLALLLSPLMSFARSDMGVLLELNCVDSLKSTQLHATVFEKVEFRMPNSANLLIKNTFSSMPIESYVAEATVSRKNDLTRKIKSLLISFENNDRKVEELRLERNESEAFEGEFRNRTVTCQIKNENLSPTVLPL